MFARSFFGLQPQVGSLGQFPSPLGTYSPSSSALGRGLSLLSPPLRLPHSAMQVRPPHPLHCTGLKSTHGSVQGLTRQQGRLSESPLPKLDQWGNPTAVGKSWRSQRLAHAIQVAAARAYGQQTSLRAAHSTSRVAGRRPRVLGVRAQAQVATLDARTDWRVVLTVRPPSASEAGVAAEAPKVDVVLHLRFEEEVGFEPPQGTLQILQDDRGFLNGAAGDTAFRWQLAEEAGTDPLDKGGLWIWGLFKVQPSRHHPPPTSAPSWLVWLGNLGFFPFRWASFRARHLGAVFARGSFSLLSPRGCMEFPSSIVGFFTVSLGSRCTAGTGVERVWLKKSLHRACLLGRCASDHDSS